MRGKVGKEANGKNRLIGDLYVGLCSVNETIYQPQHALAQRTYRSRQRLLHRATRTRQGRSVKKYKT